jgi:predicted nucleic acid-binding protein
VERFSVKASEALEGVARLFLDTAPVIYYLEKHPRYAPIVRYIFDRIDDGSVSAVASPVTLAECLVAPYRLGLTELQRDFSELIVNGRHTVFAVIDHECAHRAAELRARYNLTLPDALQIALALNTGCDAFLTNDSALQRVTELRVLVVGQME